MSAVPRWSSIRHTVLEDARLANGQAHLEAPEVVQWVSEAGDHDLAGALSEALGDVEDKARVRLCSLLALLLQQGDEIAQRKAVDLLDVLRGVMTDYSVKQAQKMVDEELL